MLLYPFPCQVSRCPEQHTLAFSFLPLPPFGKRPLSGGSPFPRKDGFGKAEYKYRWAIQKEVGEYRDIGSLSPSLQIMVTKACP